MPRGFAPRMTTKKMDEMDTYLEATEAIDCDSEAIQGLAKELTSGCASDEEKAVKLFYFVRDSIRYNIYMISAYLEDFKASTVLARGKGYCVQKAVLLTALGRAAGIPTRLAFAKIKNSRVPASLLEKTGTNVFPGHGYNQFHLYGKWVSAAATFDKELCQKNGLPPVEFDGVHDALLPESDLAGQPYIEYVELYGPQADVPIDWLRERVSRIWGEDKRAWLTR